VDACIADWVIELNRLGVYTTGCCCGHGREPSWATILPSAQAQAHNLGYAVQTAPSGEPFVRFAVASVISGPRISPEHGWRRVWHDPPCRGPMKRHRETLTIEDGSVLDLYECLACGVRCYAGLDAQRRVVTRVAP
jgi:hypothetical protein